MNKAEGTECPISNKKYPMSKERKYDLKDKLFTEYFPDLFGEFVN